MAKTLKGGHRVRFADDERLDIPDTLALSEVVYDYLNVVSAMLGAGTAAQFQAGLPVGGTLTTLVFDASTPSATTIYGPGGTATDKAVFTASYEIAPGEFEHHLLEYDPSASGQVATVNLSSYADGTTPYIWARRSDVDTATDTRRRWNTVSGSEETFSQDTREQYLIEFGHSANTTPPDTTPGWVCIAQVVSIASGVYDISPVHPFDLGHKPSEASYRWGALIKNGSASFNYMGVAQGMWDLRGRIESEIIARQAVEADVATNAADIATNAADITTNVSSLSNLAFGTIHALRVRADGSGGWTIQSPITPTDYAAATIDVASPWIFQVTFGFTTQAVMLTTGRESILPTGNYPFDIVAQYAPDGNVSPPGTAIMVYVQTLSHLSSAGVSYDWSNQPPLQPAAGTTIDIWVAA